MGFFIQRVPIENVCEYSRLALGEARIEIKKIFWGERERERERDGERQKIKEIKIVWCL